VSCIILGRGSNADNVVTWLRKAAGVPGFVGFAVGRTTFWDPLVALRDGTASRQQAVQEIADRFLRWVHVFQEASTT
jgi:myo-inositol catabolism protein IolC